MANPPPALPLIPTLPPIPLICYRPAAGHAGGVLHTGTAGFLPGSLFPRAPPPCCAGAPLGLHAVDAPSRSAAPPRPGCHPPGRQALGARRRQGQQSRLPSGCRPGTPAQRGMPEATRRYPGRSPLLAAHPRRAGRPCCPATPRRRGERGLCRAASSGAGCAFCGPCGRSPPLQGGLPETGKICCDGRQRPPPSERGLQ